MSKPTFYTAFSNSYDPEKKIPNLSEEAMKISDTLQKLAFEDKLYYMKDEVFDIQRMLSNFSTYGDRIDIFYFSGHGKDGCINLVDNFSVELGNMVEVVNSSLRNAKLLFFNACETFLLAQKIIAERKIKEGRISLIACKNDINSFIAEHFATLFFKQVGQPGAYREAYDQAKSLCKLISKNSIRFKEFETKKAVETPGDDFDIGYIEIGQENEGSQKMETKDSGSPPKPASIIGRDKLTRDALTTNYVYEVIDSIVKNGQEIGEKKIDLLKDALVAAEQIAKGEKQDRQATKLFNKAAEALPGISSGNAFISLINAEKNSSNPLVKKLVRSNDDATPISSIVSRVNSITF